MSQIPANKHSPTPELRKQVEAMSGLGITQAQIGLVVGVSDQTLRKHYREQLDRGSAVANTKVLSNLFTWATSSRNGAVTAAIFWAKTRCGFKETSTHEHVGPDGKPLATVVPAIYLKPLDNDADPNAV